MSTISQHVEECLTETSGRGSHENASKSPQMTIQKNTDLRKSSFFSSGKSLKDLEGKASEKTSPKQQKRDLSTLAGKSETSPPPGKRTKFDSKQSSSTFVQKQKENTKTQKNKKLYEIPKAMTEVPIKLKGGSGKNEFVPLAERMRPCSLHDYVGQSKVVGKNSLLRSLLEANEVPSMILWGPPGCGKVK
jgi:hypothetical protein